MKNLLFVLLLIFIVSPYSLSAQIDKGTRAVSGNFSLSASSGNSHYFSSSLGGEMRWGIAKNWMLGGTASLLVDSRYSFSKMPDSTTFRYYDRTFKPHLGVNATKYFTIRPKFYFYVEQTLGVSLFFFKVNSFPSKSTTYLYYSVSPGLMYFVHPHWALSTSITGLYSTVDLKNGRTSVNMNLPTSFSLSNLYIGVAYFWNKGDKKKE